MTLCSGNITKNCDTCYEVARADDDLVFVYGLTPSTQYYLWVVDKFGTAYKVLITTGVDGSFTIDPTNSAYPGGLFNTFAGEIEVFISSDVDGDNIVPVTIYATNYNCILLTITSTSQTGCTPSTPGCEPAYITDSDGTTIFEVGSGDSGTCTPASQCDDATVENSDLSYSNTIASGGNLVLPDIDFTDSDGITTQLPSVKNIIATPCPVKSGIGYNSQLWSGQTTVYRTYDEGYFYALGVLTPTQEANPLYWQKLVNFTTLLHLNAFGNYNRFTDENGLQVFGSNYFIDNYTGRGYATGRGFGNWDTMIDNAVIVIVAGFSDFRLANTSEMESIFDSENSGLNYAPLNTFWATSANYYQSSTTNGRVSTENYKSNRDDRAVSSLKTSGAYGVRVRTHFS